MSHMSKHVRDEMHNFFRPAHNQCLDFYFKQIPVSQGEPAFSNKERAQCLKHVN